MVGRLNNRGHVGAVEMGLSRGELVPPTGECSRSRFEDEGVGGTRGIVRVFVRAVQSLRFSGQLSPRVRV